MTKIFVLVDIEGIAGVVHVQEGDPGNAEYERARRLMTGEASAVVAGILDAEPAAEVVVADAHGPFRNIVPEELDPRARLIRGKPAPWGMMDGIGPDYDAAMFVGVHSRAGTGVSTISHTFTGTIKDVRLNGEPFGELGLNAAVAGAYGVPVVLVAGDQVVAEETRTHLGPKVGSVIVKESRGWARAEAAHPTVVQAMLRAAAAEAMGNRSAVPPLRVKEPVTVDVTLTEPYIVDMAAMIENVQRVDGVTIRAERENVLAAYRLLRLITFLCSVRT
jgi:D-amino peptidase